MSKKVLGLNKEMLLENMQWQHERLKTGKRATSAKNELSEWINKIKEGKFDVPVVSVEELKKFIKVLEGIRHVDTATTWFQDLKKDLLSAVEKRAVEK